MDGSVRARRTSKRQEPQRPSSHRGKTQLRSRDILDKRKGGKALLVRPRGPLGRRPALQFRTGNGPLEGDALRGKRGGGRKADSRDQRRWVRRADDSTRIRTHSKRSKKGPDNLARARAHLGRANLENPAGQTAGQGSTSRSSTDRHAEAEPISNSTQPNRVLRDRRGDPPRGNTK